MLVSVIRQCVTVIKTQLLPNAHRSKNSAETVANRERIIQGQQEGVLTEYGKKQAKRLAKRLQMERVDFVYTSDLKRARQTTKKIAKRHPDAVVIRDRRLRERVG
jgi:broad specificity phosphatase PhoE